MYNYYGTQKTGFPVPPLTARAFNAQTWPSGDPVTEETPVALAKLNRQGYWLSWLFGVSDGGASATGTDVFGGFTATLDCQEGISNDNDLYTPPDRWIVRAPLVCPT